MQKTTIFEGIVEVGGGLIESLLMGELKRAKNSDNRIYFSINILVSLIVVVTDA